MANMNVTRYPNHTVFYGEGTNAGDVLFTIDDADPFDSFVVLAHNGAVTVEVSFDGQNWSNPVALQDMAGTTIDQEAVASNLNCFGLVIRTTKLRVKQSGATAAKANVSCWSTGRKS